MLFFNADIEKHHISAVGHARKFKFSSYVHLLSINHILQYRHARLILCNEGEVFIFEHGLYISALEHATMLILISYVHLASVNKIYKYCHA